MTRTPKQSQTEPNLFDLFQEPPDPPEPVPLPCTSRPVSRKAPPRPANPTEPADPAKCRAYRDVMAHYITLLILERAQYSIRDVEFVHDIESITRRTLDPFERKTFAEAVNNMVAAEKADYRELARQIQNKKYRPTQKRRRKKVLPAEIITKLGYAFMCHALWPTDLYFEANEIPSAV